MCDTKDDKEKKIRKPSGKETRTGMQVVGGAIPFVGGILSAAASHWSESEQEKVNDFFQEWIKMLEDEIREKGQTIVEITSRLDMQDEKINERIHSKEYQALLKKSFREWAAAESEEKRILLRNILANAAAATIISDDVIRLFLDWLKMYSELHFKVIRVIYNEDGITRGQMWQKMNKPNVSEDSAEADLFKLIIRDLSTGGLIRQHRKKDAYGNFIREQRDKKSTSEGGSTALTSAFDDEKSYELTELGKQFIHYAMNDLPLKISGPKGENVESQEVSEKD